MVGEPKAKAIHDNLVALGMTIDSGFKMKLGV